MSNPFPSLVIEGPSVDASRHVEPGTGTAQMLGYVIAVFAFLGLTVATTGVFLVISLFYPLFSWYINRKAMALIHGSGIKIDADQLPEVHQCVTEFSKRLGVKTPVSVYLVEDNVANAGTVRYGRRNVIFRWCH